MTSRVTSVEGSVARLEEKIDRQHSRLEGLLREVLGSHVAKSNPAVQQIPEPPSTIPETSMAAAVRVALASEPCPRVSLKDDVQVNAEHNASESIVSDPSAVTGVKQGVDGQGNEDPVPMDVEGVTESVENVVSAVGGTTVADDQVIPETDVYDMEDVTVPQATQAEVADLEEKVCKSTVFSESCCLLSDCSTACNPCNFFCPRRMTSRSLQRLQATDVAFRSHRCHLLPPGQAQHSSQLSQVQRKQLLRVKLHCRF